MEVDQYDPDDQEDETFAKDLPDGRIILVRDIRKAISGEAFKVYPSSGGMPLDCRGIPPEDVNSYLSLFHRFRLFGLPHGKGWQHELPWVVDMFEFLSGTYEVISAWHISRATPPDTGEGLSWEDS